MTTDPSLSQPQRLHPLTVVLGPLRLLRAWAIPIVAAFFIRPGEAGEFAGFGIVLAIVAVGVAAQVMQVLRVRWWVADDAFQMRVGLVQLESRSVPLERIQNVDISEPLFPRLLGLAEVKIETAGSSGGDLALRFVSRPDADRLREVLASRRASVVEALEPAAPRTLVRAELGELVLAGATTNRIGALLVVFGAMWGFAIDVGIDPEDAFVGAGDLLLDVGPVLLAVTGLAAMVLVGWVVSIAATVLRYYGFVLTEQGNELRRDHGLLSRSSGVIPLRRVQAVRIEQAWMRRIVHRSTIVADTAGSVAAATDTGTGVVAPIIRDAAVASLVQRVVGMPVPDESELLPVSRLAIRRGFIRVALPLIVSGGGVLFFRPLAAWIVVPLLALAYWWARLRYRALGYRVGTDLVVARSGVVTRRRWFVPTTKVQSTVVRSSPFQRRLGLATLSLDTAGPGTQKVTVIDLEVDAARSMAADLSALSSLSGLESDGV